MQRMPASGGPASQVVRARLGAAASALSRRQRPLVERPASLLPAAAAEAQTEQAEQQQDQQQQQQRVEQIESLLPHAACGMSEAAAAAPAAPAAAPAPPPKEQAQEQVPSTLPQALAVFLSHPSTLLIIAALGGMLAWRAQSPAHPAADAAVVAAVAAGWCIQEWLMHALLLHSSFDWVGRRIHVGHHYKPYFHVSIDDPPLVCAFALASFAVFWGAFRGSELALTAVCAYYACGLCYEWTHFISHTRYLPRSKWGKAVRMHHMLHHTRSEENWLAFSVPQVDALFGTLPAPATVRQTPMAKAALAAGRSGGSGSTAGGSSAS